MPPIRFNVKNAPASDKPKRRTSATTRKKPRATKRKRVPGEYPHILIDDRAGSRDLVEHEPLNRCAVLTRLDSADVAFAGYGMDEKPISIGIEVKSIYDLLSSIETGRLQGTQVPTMLDTYDESWLLHYGIYCAGDGGTLDVWRDGRMQPYTIGDRAFRYTFLVDTLYALSLLGVRVARVGKVDEAAQWIAALARWWDKPWSEKHSRLRAFDNSRSIAMLPLKSMSEETKVCARMAAHLPGVGVERALTVARHFGNATAMILASEAEWLEISGIGKTIARSVRQVLLGE